MKVFKKLLIAMLSALCLGVGIAGIVACKKDKGGDDRKDVIGDDYKAVYNVYKEAAGADAMSLEDWYADISADIQAVGGTVSAIDTLDYDNAQYLKVTFQSGKLYLEPLVAGGALAEYSNFTLNVKDEAGTQLTTATRAYIDIYSIAADSQKTTLSTLATNAYGKVEVYTPVQTEVVTYYVQVNDQSSATYGIPLGYEPQLVSDGGSSTVDVTLYTPVTYTVSIHDNAELEREYTGIKVSLRYTDAGKENIAVASGEFGADGEDLTLTLTLHPESGYKVYVDNDNLPAGFAPVDPIEADLEEMSTTLELYTIKNYAEDVNQTYSDPVQQTAPIVKDIELVTLPSGSATVNLTHVESGDTYTYNGKQVYIALTCLNVRIGEKTIAQLNEEQDEDGYYKFTGEDLTTPAINQWTRYIYHDMIAAYAAKVDENGVYPLNTDLYNFVQAAAKYQWFDLGGYNENARILLPLVVYGADRIVVGYEEGITASGAVYFKQGDVAGYEKVTDGYYMLEATSASLTSNNNFVPDLTCKIGDKTVNRYFKFNEVASDDPDAAKTYVAYVHLSEGQEYINVSASGLKVSKLDVTKEKAMSISYLTSRPNATIGWADDISAEALAQPQLITAPDKAPYQKEYKILVYPYQYLIKNWQVNYNASAPKNNNLLNAAYMFDFSNPNLSYSVTTVSGSEKLGKVNRFAVTTNLANNNASSTYSYWTFGMASSGGVNEPGGSKALTPGASRSASTPFTAFFHGGTDIEEITIRVTAQFTKGTVHYSAGEGEGEDYATDPLSSSAYTVLDVTAPELNYTYAGHTFTGWKYTDPETNEEKIVNSGEQLKLSNSAGANYYHNYFLEAQWQETKAKDVEGKLGTGDGAKLENVALDGGQYTSTEIALADGVTAGAYKLTADLGDSALDSLYAEFNGATTLFIKDKSVADKNVYIAYLNVTDVTAKLIFPTFGAEYKATITSLTLEKFEVTLAADAETLAPVNGYTADEGATLVKVNLGDIPNTAGNYKVTLDFGTEGFVYNVKIFTESGFKDFGKNLTGNIEINSTDKTLWIMGNSALYSADTVVSIKLERGYRVRFDLDLENNPDVEAAGGTGLKVPDPYLDKNPGEEFVFNKSASATGYTLWCWKYTIKGDEKKVYNNENFTIPEGEYDIVMTAVWKKTNAATYNLMLVGKDEERNEGNGVKFRIDTEGGGEEQAITSVKFNASVKAMTSYALIFDLGKSDYSGVLEFNAYYGTSKVIAIHSEALSKPEHNIFVGFINYGGSGSTSNSITYPLTLQNYAAMRGFDGVPKIEGTAWIVEKANSELVLKVGEEYKTTASLRANDTNVYYMLNFDDALLTGAKYTLHAKYNGSACYTIADPALHIYKGSGNIQNVPMTAVEGKENEWTVEVEVGMANGDYRVLIATFTKVEGVIGTEVKNLSMAVMDVWLTKLDLAPEEAAKQLSTEAPQKITVSKTQSAEVTLSETVKKSAYYYVWATFDGEAPDTEITVAGVSNYKLNKANGYKVRYASFANKTVTVTVTSEEAITPTLHIAEFKEVLLNFDNQDEAAGRNNFTLPADKGEIDLFPMTEFGTNTGSSNRTRYSITITFTDKQAHESTVIKYVHRDGKTYTLNKDNNWTVGNLLIVSSASEHGKIYMWCESGEEVQVHATVAKCATVFVGDSATYNPTIELSSTVKTVKGYISVTSGTLALDGSRMIKLTLTPTQVDTSAAGKLTVTYNGDKTAEFKLVDTKYEAELLGLENEEIVINYTGDTEFSAKLGAAYTQEVTLNYGTQVLENDAAKTEFFANYSMSGKFYLKVTLHGGTKDASSAFDFSSATLTLTKGGGSSGNDQLVISGFAKQGEGNDYVAYILVYGKSDFKFTLGGVSVSGKYVLQFDCYYYDEMTTTYSSFSSLGSSTCTEVYIKPGETKFQTGEKYMLMVTDRGDSSCEGDNLTYTITSGVQNAPITLSKDNDYKQEVTLTGEIMRIVFAGHNGNAKSHSTYFFMEKQSVIEEVAELGTIGSDVNITLLGKNVPRTVKVTADVEERTMYSIVPSTSGTLTLTYKGESYQIKTSSGVALLLSKNDTFTLSGTSSGSSTVRIKMSVSTTAATKVEKGVTSSTISLTSSSAKKILLGASIDLNKPYKVTITTTNVKSNKDWNAQINFGGLFTTEILVDQEETATDKNITDTHTVTFTSPLLDITYTAASGICSITITIEDVAAE